MINQQTRNRRIYLPDNVPAQLLSSIIEELDSLEAINSLSHDNGKLSLQYSFPAITFGKILQVIDHHLGTAGLRLVDKPGYSFTAWMEDNERDHLYLHHHWDRYARDTHIAHSNPGFTSMTQAKKQWQQYRNPDKPKQN